MLSSDQFTFPSGYAVRQQPIVDGFITIDLANGGKGRDSIFKQITSRNPSKIAQQQTTWQQEGVKYVESPNAEAKYKLSMPIHNMNDGLFVYLFQTSNFGNWEIESNKNYGIMSIYTGYREDIELFSSETLVDDTNFLEGIAELKKQAEAQQRLGYRYMRVATGTSTETHAENIDIAALLDLDLSYMEAGKAYPIDDRNWCDSMSQDIPRLSIRKKMGKPYEWGTLLGYRFEPSAVSTIKVYVTDIKAFSPTTT
jgi:hypothetical protein